MLEYVSMGYLSAKRTSQVLISPNYPNDYDNLIFIALVVRTAATAFDLNCQLVLWLSRTSWLPKATKHFGANFGQLNRLYTVNKFAKSNLAICSA